jgi:hypothetical protein
MFESLDGSMVPATRQNAGRVLNGAVVPAGGVNCPAATTCAIAMVVSANFRLERSSHLVAAAADPAAKSTPHQGNLANAKTFMIPPPPFLFVIQWLFSA